MSPALKNEQPQGFIARFGTANNPLFLVERGTGENSFLIRDADQGLDESERRLGLVAIDHVDAEARQAEVEVELNAQAGEASYKMTPGDLVAAIGAVVKAEDLVEVEITADSNVPPNMLDQITGPQELKSSNPEVEPFEFQIAA